MTINSTISKVQHLGDNSTTIFSFPFLVLESDDMQVYLDGDLQVGGYTIQGIGDPNGGTVTFGVAPVLDIIVTLLRSVDILQETDYTPFDAFPAETHELALDYLTMICQQLQEEIDRTILAPPGAPPDVDFSPPIYDAGKGWMWSESDPKEIINSDQNLNGIVEDAEAARDISIAAATAASISETNAASSETIAANAAIAADISETNAAASETNAAASEIAAVAAADAAVPAAAEAVAARDIAVPAAAAAAASEIAAASSEGNASSSEASALASAGNAAVSETNALISAQNAQASADDALAAANAAGGWDVSIVHNGPLNADAVTRVITNRGLKWVFDTPAIGFVGTAPASPLVITFTTFDAGGSVAIPIGTITFAGASNVGVWAPIAGVDVPVTPGTMVGCTFPADMLGAEDFSSVLPLALDITATASPPGDFDILLPETFIPNYNIRDAINALGYAGDIPANVIIRAQPGTSLYTEIYGSPGLRTGVFFPGSVITVINDGIIYGHGGDGANGVPEGGNVGGTGQAGDPMGAITMDWDLSIDNTNGQILSGGGGGGSGASGNGFLEGSGGGGGGQGFRGGGGGLAGSITSGPGGNGGSGGPGAGGLTDGAPPLGRGGSGGAHGQPGDTGEDWNAVGGPGGLTGNAINSQGNTYTDLGTGVITGPIV